MDFIENTPERAVWIAYGSHKKIESLKVGTCYRYSYNKTLNAIKKHKLYIYKEHDLTVGNNPSILDVAFHDSWWIRLSTVDIHASCTGPDAMIIDHQWDKMLDVPLGCRNNEIYYFTDECDDEVLKYFTSKIEKSIKRCENTLIKQKEKLSLLKLNGITI